MYALLGVVVSRVAGMASVVAVPGVPSVAGTMIVSSGGDGFRTRKFLG